MFIKDNEIIFGAYSYGYRTRYQDVTFDADAPTYDTHLFKLNPEEANDCLYISSFSSSDMTPVDYDDGLNTNALIAVKHTGANLAAITTIRNDRYLFK